MVWKNMRNACGRPGASIFIMSISRSFAKPTPSTVCTSPMPTDARYSAPPERPRIISIVGIYAVASFTPL